MQFHFDLISDLHLDSWPEFNWEGQPTSPYCVVAGDVARDRDLLVSALEHLGQCYQNVFFIDGNDEHRDHWLDMGDSYKNLSRSVKSIKNVIYLQDHVVIINGVAILATNGWWTFDLDTNLEFEQSQSWFCDQVKVPSYVADDVTRIGFSDTNYMINSVQKLQTHRDVKAIVCVTHSTPAPWLINHDIDLVNTWRFNSMGNPHMQRVLDADTENKIHTWCFGHYHSPVDRYFSNIRYVNNCRGRGDWAQAVYYPKRITIDF